MIADFQQFPFTLGGKKPITWYFPMILDFSISELTEIFDFKLIIIVQIQFLLEEKTIG